MIDYYDFEETVKYFYRLSLAGEMKFFNFHQAFEALRQPIERKLIEHGLGSYEEFCDFMDEIYDFRCIESFTVDTGYVYIGKEDVKDAILRLHYEKSNEAFRGISSFEDLQDILYCIDDMPESMPERIALFDRIIHAQHETGDIFDDIDPDEIREEIEAEWMEERGE